MQKRNLRSNKIEKTGPTKRRGGNTNYRSINNFQSIDKVPNDNLYKNDNLYSIKKISNFQKCKKNLFIFFFITIFK